MIWQLVSLHRVCSKCISMFFTYDRMNYSRYLKVHHQDLLSLQKQFWEVYAEFERGNILVQVPNTNPFGRAEADSH